jgi:hypothetical protein
MENDRIHISTIFSFLLAYVAEKFEQNSFVYRYQVESATTIQEGRMLDLDPFPKMFDF